jgi:hypothetical protein
MRKHRTRVKAQDMKTGEFAYLDQLIRDGYFPNLWVLPKNYEPPIFSGPIQAIPFEPIFNFSPPNITDSTVVNIGSLINQDTGRGVLLPQSDGEIGHYHYSVFQLMDGISSDGELGSILNIITQPVSGTSSSGETGTVNNFANQNIPSIESIGIANAAGVVPITTGDVVTTVDGIASNGLMGTVLNGSGWGQGGGWGQNGWGVS